jgi:hypothetical protein
VIAKLLKPIPSSIIALIVYGGWAAFTNLSHGTLIATKAFLVQGIFALLATLGLSLLARRLYDQLGKNYSALTAAFCSCFLIIATVPALLHTWVGTPNIIQSILPGLIWGTLYLTATLVQCHKESQS